MNSIPPSVPPKPNNRRRFTLACSGCFGLLVMACCLYGGIGAWYDQGEYNKGRAAYEAGDCRSAIPYYDTVIGSPTLGLGGYNLKSETEKAECEPFLAAQDLQAAGSPGPALAGYTDFINNHGSSPLVTYASQAINGLFSQTPPAGLASLESCQALVVMVEKNLVPQPEQNLPQFYMACGQVYENGQDYTNAIAIYERFQRDYPAHAFSGDVEKSLARSLVAQAKAQGAGSIPAQERSGSVGGTITEVIIQNDSPSSLRIVFSGPESHIEELAPCADCTKFSGDGPEFCPEKGPIGRYTLPPGAYDVLVQSTDGSSITPWTGAWELLGGDEYYSCFFVVTQE